MAGITVRTSQSAESKEEAPSSLGVENFPHKSAASPPTCSALCQICSTHYLPLSWQSFTPYATKMPDSKAQDLIQDSIQAVETNLSYLRQTIQSHGDVLLRRWRKRSQTKRAAILRKAMPDMPRDQWFEARAMSASTVTSEPARSRTAWLLPYLSINALCEQWPRLLALMHARTTIDRSEWVLFDNSCLKNAFDFGFIGIRYNPHCVSVRIEGFGKLVQWDESEAHRLDIIGFPRAQLALEAQATLSTFLCSMCDLLLGDDVNAPPSGCDVWHATLVTGSTLNKRDELAKFTYNDEAFTKPCSFDPEHLQSLLDANLSDARDQLWQLQTDPIHFREYLAQALEDAYTHKFDGNERLSHMVEHAISAVTRLDHAERMASETRLILTRMQKYRSVAGLPGSLPAT